MKILVALDFSKESLHGLESACTLCSEKKGEVVVVHVVEGIPAPSLNVAGELAKGSRERDIYVKLLVDRTKEQLGALIVDEKYRAVRMSYRLEIGKVFDKLHELIEREAPDLLVMGSKGAEGLGEFFVGSNAEKMSKFAPCPLIVVKSFADFTKMKNIVYPTDFRDEQKNIVEHIKYIQGLLGAHLHLVKVFEPVLVTDEDVMQRVVDFIRKYELTESTPAVWHHHDEEEGILEFASSIEADMVLMGTHGRRGIASLLGGNISQHLINHAKIPVCTVRLA